MIQRVSASALKALTTIPALLPTLGGSSLLKLAEKHNELVKPNFITYKPKISELENQAVQTALQHRSTPE